MAIQTDDEALKRARQQIKEALLRGEKIRATGDGQLVVARSQEPGSQNGGIVIPEAKLASFYWYESDPDLLEGEVKAMTRAFPQFASRVESDGRFSWIGQVTPGYLKPSITYTLHAVYEHSHPNNDNFGGSVKVYCVYPDLDEIASGKSIPHRLPDSAHEYYICTSEKKDFKAGTTINSIVTSAAVCVGWAIKWLTVFELWITGVVSTEEFQSHAF